MGSMATLVSRLLVSTALVGVTNFGSIGAANAQLAEASVNSTDANEIVVTGARAENTVIINEKRQNKLIADYLGADEAGKLPDLNIAESLSNIPGVAAIFDEDRARFVTVRGLKSSLNYTALDGIGIATTDDFGGTGRQVNLEVIPPGSVGLLEVRKTFTPDVDGGAIGGYVNLHTRSAFDSRRKGLVIQAGLNLQTYKAVPGVNSERGPLSSGVGGQIDASYITRFGADEQFGLVLSGQFAQDSRDESKNIQASEGYYNSAGVAVNPILNDGTVNPAWNGFVVPREVRSFDYTNRTRNYGGNAKLEYKGNSIYASLLGFYYAEDQQETRKLVQVFGLASPRNLTATSGDLTYGEARTGWNFNTLDKQNSGVIANLRADIGSTGVFNLVGGWSYAEFSDFQPLMDFRTIPTNRAVSYEVTGTGPRINRFTFADTAAILNPANYRLLAFNETTRLSTEDLYNIKASYAHNRKPDDVGLGFELGGEYRRIDRVRDNARTDYTVGTTPLGTYAIQTQFQPSWVNFPLLWVDGPAFSRFAPTALAVNATSTADQAVISDYRYVEDTKAGFALAQYRGDRLFLVGGARYEDVSTTAISPGERLSNPFITRKGGYSKWLPSLSLAFDATDDLVLKGAISRSLGRPNPGDIAQRERRNDVTFTISRGNPDLLPRTSINYDLGLEYYLPGRNGLLSVALFYKDIKNEIFTRSAVESIDGVDYQVTQPRNAEGAKVKGVEFGAVVNSLDFIAEPLSGFGLSANLTYTDAEVAYINLSGVFDTFPHLEDQPSWSGNASIFYQFGKKAELRMTYNYRGEYYDAIPTQPWVATGRAANGQLGAFFRYNLTDNIALKFKARNLLNANSQRLRGLDLEDLHEETEYGQSFYFDVQFKF